VKFTTEYLSKYIEQLPMPSDLDIISKDFIDLGLEVESITNNSDDNHSVQQKIIELAIAPNRADLMSMVGIARELALKYSSKLKYPVAKQIVNNVTTATKYQPITVKLNAPQSCPKYLGRAVLAIDNQATTPDWIKQVLINADISLISPVVDVTNYVMLELGQPLHVFDLDKISNKQITVRQAIAKEKIMLLDDSQVELSTEDLVIADGNKAIAIAGVMGGLDSAVTSDTKNIFIECAYFDPISIRMTANRHKILTDSSQRFARHIDHNLPEFAMQRISDLLQEIVAGQYTEVVTAISKSNLPTATVINLDNNRIKQVLGFCPEDKIILEIFQGLDMLVKHNTDGWKVTIPSWRPDITIQEDLIEELARFIGYNNIAQQAIALPLKFDLPERQLNFTEELKYKNYLANRGYFETINYSFIDHKIAEIFCKPEQLYQLKNPISSSMNVMRPSLVPGLITTLLHNQHRKQNRMRIFELGTVFRLDPKSGNIKQEKKIAGLINGTLLPENWQHAKQPADFFALKNDVIASINIDYKKNILFKKLDKDHDGLKLNSILHPLQSASIYVDEVKVGEIGKLHPELLEKFDITGAVYLFELDLSLIYQPKIVKFKQVSKFPAIRRDFSIIIEQEVDCNRVKQEILVSCGELLQEIVFFDLFTGGNLPPNKKSLAFGVILQHQDKTLVEEEISQVVTKITDNLSNIGAQLRV
jgi:phenylalanyl-tRNA synthetase beta chain